MWLKSANPHLKRTYCVYVGCGVGVVRSRMFLGGVGFLTTLGVGVWFFCPVFFVHSGCPFGSFFKSHS